MNKKLALFNNILFLLISFSCSLFVGTDNGKLIMILLVLVLNIFLLIKLIRKDQLICNKKFNLAIFSMNLLWISIIISYKPRISSIQLIDLLIINGLLEAISIIYFLLIIYMIIKSKFKKIFDSII